VIVIEGDKIATVGPAKSVKAPADAEVIELPRATVLPGLIDCHVHLTISPNLWARPVFICPIRAALCSERGTLA
jgi:imidazolonepropionase-like amidohydrolase